jgi:poly(A) polymerase
MERLGLPPGPAVGRAMAFLKELRIEAGVLGPDEVTRRLDAWWAEQQHRA